MAVVPFTLFCGLTAVDICEGCTCKSTNDLLRGAVGQSLLWQLGHFLLLGGTCGTLNTGSLLKLTLLCNRLEQEGLLLGEVEPMEPLLAFLKPYLGGLASEVSLHLLGNVGKCILDKDGWKTDSALPGASACQLLLTSIPPGVNTNFWAAQQHWSRSCATRLPSSHLDRFLVLLLNGLLKFGDRQKDGQRKW